MSRSIRLKVLGLKLVKLDGTVIYLGTNKKARNELDRAHGLPLVLCKLPISFTTVKLTLEHNFSQFIQIFRIGVFEYWS